MLSLALPSESNMTIQSLPNELLLMVTEYLSSTDIKHLIETNKQLSIIMKPLLDRIAMQDKEGLTSLCWASQHGHTSLVSLLLRMGADITLPSGRFDGTPLQWATFFSQEAIVHLLLTHNANPMARDRFGATALHSALHSSEHTIRLLLEHGADPNAVDIDDETPLHYAAFCGNAGMIRLLLEHGADVNFRNADGEVPLHHAVDIEGKASLGEQREALEILLGAGGDVHARDYMGRMPLHWAAEKCHLKATEVLLEAGADVHARDSNGETPLHIVARARKRRNGREVAGALISRRSSFLVNRFTGESTVALGKRYGLVGPTGRLKDKSTAQRGEKKKKLRRTRALLDRQ
ncbi:ankyrin repeat-containing domain protein [Tuber brumale]|nr:ankyrin repeat-containing domain protein [Tuber brumale]